MSNTLHHASVLIVSDDSEFARTVAARWQAEPRATGITIATSDVWHPSVVLGYDLVIAGPVGHGKLSSVLAALSVASGSPAISVIHVVEHEKDIPLLRTQHPHLLFLAQQDGWINALILISSESLRRIEAVARAQRAERLAQSCQQDATLGRYMIEMRPGINNALTSVLGNADLLMLDSGKLAPQSREQVRTIHSMALRLHQVVQRFSSLAAEMTVAENESHDETEAVSHRVAVRP
jgi:signal transduction histidine kinase